MFSSIWNDIKREFQFGNMITRVVIVNVLIFLVVNAIRISLYIFNRGFTPPIFDHILHYFCVGKAWEHNLYHPWVFFTNMFLHVEFFHLLWNMLYLYWFGRIVGDLIGNHRILPIYILGGLAGAVIYFLSANYFNNLGDFALGASAAVMAIVVTAGAIAPDYVMRFMFVGDVKLKYVVAILLLLDLIGIATTINSGGHLAHLGGAAMGYLFAIRLRNGQDLAAPINVVIDFFTNWKQLFQPKKSNPKRPKPHMAYKNKDAEAAQNEGEKPNRSFEANDSDNQAHLDSILDKIKLSGYDSLTQTEKEFLFKMSK
jgi:membrane associated rhomboid family serine protease